MSSVTTLLAGLAFASTEATLQCLSLLMIPVACRLPGARAMGPVVAYCAAAALPTPWIVHAYTSNVLQAGSAYVALVTLNAGVLGLALVQQRVPRSIAVPAALIVLCLPPLSSINPLALAPLAGWLFPGFGLYGLASLVLLVAGLSAASRWRLTSVAALLVVIVPTGAVHATIAPSDITGISITRPHDERLSANVMRLAYRHEERDLVDASHAAIAILPESVFGEWSPIGGAILSTLPGRVYGGARVFVDSNRTRNVIVDAKTGEIIYEQLNTPPLTRPDNPQVTAGRGVVIDPGFRPLICYELTNPWLTIQAFHSTTNPIVWISNLGWFDTPYLERRLRSVLTAWGRLFDRETQGAVIRHG